MKNFIYVQYQLYKSNHPSIGIDKIIDLAEKFLTQEEKAELFN